MERCIHMERFCQILGEEEARIREQMGEASQTEQRRASLQDSLLIVRRFGRLVEDFE